MESKKSAKFYIKNLKVFFLGKSGKLKATFKNAAKKFVELLTEVKLRDRSRG